MHSPLSVVAPTIAIIPILIVAGRVAHDLMTAIKSGSAGDDCGSLSVSTALAPALATLDAFQYALFSSGSFTRASVFEIEGIFGWDFVSCFCGFERPSATLKKRIPITRAPNQ